MVATINWHGWRRATSSKALHIGPLPGRKSIALYENDGIEETVFAYFTSVENAEKAMNLVDALLKGFSQ